MTFLIWLRLNGGFSNGTRFKGSTSDFLLAGGTSVRPPAPIFTQSAHDISVHFITTLLMNMNKTKILNQGLSAIVSKLTESE